AARRVPRAPAPILARRAHGGQVPDYRLHGEHRPIGRAHRRTEPAAARLLYV
ncbi:MAG: hypothetical protein AVDCRST_MAG68-4014, partial [uncultured Gemmatimonadetes bacterium]